MSFTLIAEKAHAEQVPLQENQQFSEAELAQMLAPIALYPDSLLTHILIASTYPIEIIEAHRWLKKNDGLSPEKLSQSVEDFNWDASVKALIPFERILTRLSDDLTWSQQLGDAFLQSEEKLLESIQTLRKQADLAGNLNKMDNMEVSYEDNNIIIVPVEKEIVYVPYYDTRMVYGAWYWAAYPPIYWTPHHSVYISPYSPFYWHSGIHISFNYFFSAFHWHNRHVVVVNSYRSHKYRGRHQISRGGYAQRWSHKPAHRKGVAYRNKHTSQKYRSNSVRVNKANKKSHSVQRSNTQRRFKQGLAIKNYPSSKRQSHKVQVNNRVISRAKSKELQSKKVYQHKIKSKKVTAKNHSKSASKRTSVPSRKKQNNFNKKPNHQHKSMKGQRLSAVNTKYK